MSRRYTKQNRLEARMSGVGERVTRELRRHVSHEMSVLARTLNKRLDAIVDDIETLGRALAAHGE